MAQVLEDPWFKEGYKPENNKVEEEINVDDVHMVFNDSKVWETQMGSLILYQHLLDVAFTENAENFLY